MKALKPYIFGLCTLAGVMGLYGCSGVNSPNSNSMAPGSDAFPMPNTIAASAQSSNSSRDLSRITTWSLNIQTIPSEKREDISLDNADIMVVSPSQIEVPKRTLAKQVSNIRGKNTGRLIALLNISSIDKEDKQWSDAWADKNEDKLTSSAPAWLIAHPESKEKQINSTYFVRYWNADWQSKLKSQIDALRDAGFDGVCLSGCDRYTAAASERVNSAEDMSALVISLAAEARNKKPNFIVLPMNEAGLIQKLEGKKKTDYLAAIDGVIAQNVFYKGAKPFDNDLNPQGDIIVALDMYRGANKTVLVSEQLSSKEKTNDFMSRASTRHYIPFIIKPADAKENTESKNGVLDKGPAPDVKDTTPNPNIPIDEQHI